MSPPEPNRRPEEYGKGPRVRPALFGRRSVRAPRLLLPSLVLLVLAGCKTGTFANPNDPRGAGAQQPEVLRRQVKGASDALLARVVGGEITDAQYRDLLAKYTDDLLKGVAIESVDPTRAWEYGEVFKTGRLWGRAERAYRIASGAAKNEDRRVNDTLQLANALAHLGKTPEAVREARKTFDAPPQEKAPILYAIYLEIAPAGKGQGHDADLARLIEDAIRQSDLVKVDERTEAGQAFLLARPHHQRNARRLAAELYLSAGKPAEAERVLGGKLPSVKI